MNRLFALIEISGDDAVEFLQGQLTQDVKRLSTVSGLPAAWCNAKGRVIAVIRLIRVGATFALAVPAASASSVVRRLLMFRLRSRVHIATADHWIASATRSPDDLEHLDELGLLPDPQPFSTTGRDGVVAFELSGANRCVELFGSAPAFEECGIRLRHELGMADWRSAQIGAGIPLIEGETMERFTAHMLNLDLLGAISFTKGCYTGQEVIARTEHLGESKRRLAGYRLASGTASPGDRLEHDGREVGEVINACGPELLAVVPVTLHGTTLSLGGSAAEPVPLPRPLAAAP